MKIRFAAIGAVAITLIPVLRLPAQDVTVGEVGWFRAEGVPGQPPQMKRRLRVDYPDEMRKAGDVGYAIIFRHLDAAGQSLTLQIRATQLAFQRSIEKATRDWSMRPAAHAGRPVPAQFWIPVIFNPASASPDGPDATPRLLAVAPVVVKDKPPGGEAPVWATVSLDVAGAPVSFALESPESEVLRSAIETALKAWRFAPARKAGQAVPAGIRVAFLCYPPAAPVPANQSPPRVVSQAKPIYPFAQVANGLKGEVRLEFVVDRTGKVVNPVVVQSSNPAFDQPAIDALLKWKFEPARVDGRAVNTKMAVPIIFEIDGGGGREAFTVESAGRKAQERLPEELRYDTPPKPRGTIIPVYPYGLLRDDRAGKATVAFVVDAGGEVVETKVVAASDPEFGLALAAAVETFRFDPALKDGRPVPAVIRMEQEFDRYSRGQNQTLTDADRALLKQELKRPGTIVPASQLDGAPKPLSRRPPVFPLAQRGQADRGSALIEVLVDEDGRARLPRIVEASNPAFGYAAAQAVSEWKFEPPKSGGKPAVVRVRIPFAFELKAATPPPAASRPPPAHDGP